MCRLFGFRSIIQSQVHDSLYAADNALLHQSKKHPDGWGVAYYVDHYPHMIKSEKTAFDDSIFSKVSGVVSSETVVAHIRNATHGNLCILNTHPFQYGSWVFAHNGNIKDFEKYRDEIKKNISPKLKRFILGETDSEIIFYFLLTHLSEHIDLSKNNFVIDTLASAIRDAIDHLIKIVGEYSKKDLGPTETYMNFIITNGASMIAHQGGLDLYYSTYKKECHDRTTCANYSYECEHPTKTGFINHLIFASEPLLGNNIWIRMKPGDLVGTDNKMKLCVYPR